MYDLGDYEQRWGDVYNMFHRQCMHGMLMAAAVAEEGEGAAVKVVVDAKCVGLDTETGVVRFEDGRTAVHEVVIGADGIGVSRFSFPLSPLFLASLLPDQVGRRRKEA